MAPRVSGRVDPLAEYLASLFEEDRNDKERMERLMLSFAELQFQRRGGGRCAVCNAPVRLVIPISAKQKDGSLKEFECLCQRCLEGERDQATMVRMQIGDAKVELMPRQRPATNGRRRRARSA
jgi:hypothetical protein